VVDNERRSVALVSMQAIVTSLIALFSQEGCNFPLSLAHRISPTRGRRVRPKRDRPRRDPW
jgi:hypothetical protein